MQIKGKLLEFYFYLFICMCIYPYTCAQVLELELQVVANHTTWVLGVKLSSSKRAASTLTHGSIPPAPLKVLVFSHIL